MKIDISQIKELRKLTHAPLGECKKALAEAWGDIEKAQEVLKKNGALKAAKKWDRVTEEWIVKYTYKNWVVCGIKVLCETDFVAKNETFLVLVDKLLEKIVDHTSDISSKDNADSSFVDMLQKTLDENVAKVWESLRLTDVFRKTHTAYVYNHMWYKVAAIVMYDGEENAQHEEAAKYVALQAAAMNPLNLSVDDVPQSRKDELHAWFMEELKNSGKPEDIIWKIAEWKMRKIREEEVLLEQVSIVDNTKKVKDLVPKTMTIVEFIRAAV